MSENAGIFFFPTPVAMTLGILALAGTAWLGWVAWKRSGYRRSIGWLELFRWILVALVGITLCQPEWLAPSTSDARSTIVVLWDQSKSMLTEDVLIDPNSSQSPVSRMEAIQPWLEESAWENQMAADTLQSGDLQWIFEPFSSELDPPESGTDLNQALNETLDRYNSLRAALVISDGDWNTGTTPAQAAAQFRMREIPIYAVGAGSETPLPDIELVSLDAPTFAIQGKPIQMPFEIRSSLGQDLNVTAILKIDGVVDQNQVVRLPALETAQGSWTWTPQATGNFELSVELVQDPLDRVQRNNILSTPIEVREEAFQVLIIESYPRWEYRYLRNALERDPGVDVTCLLFHPDLPQKGGGRGYIQAFPTSNELNRFDVVILGDVGIGEKQLTEEQAEDIRQLISAQASGLVFLPGRYGFQETLTEGPLADLYPVVFDMDQPEGYGSEQPGHFALTQTGQRSLLTKLAEGAQENSEVWSKIPGFHWYAPALRAKLGSETLAVHDQETNASGRIPLIVTKTFGAGKCLFMGADSAWRWREGVEDRYHYRFWGQVARWMAYQRQKSSGSSMRLFTSPDLPEVNEKVQLKANVLDPLGAFLEEDDVVVEAISPSGSVQSIRLQPGTGDAAGMFSGVLIPKEPGMYQLSATSETTGSQLELDLRVQGKSLEAIGRVARLNVLEEITSMTGGSTTSLNEINRLVQELGNIPEPDPIVHRTRLWANPYWGGMLVFLLGMFWTFRKIVGEV